MWEKQQHQPPLNMGRLNEQAADQLQKEPFTATNAILVATSQKSASSANALALSSAPPFMTPAF